MVKFLKITNHTPLRRRLSTGDQSCARQIVELQAFADRAGYDVVGVFAETASGASSKRPARKQVLDLAQGRHIDAVLVTVPLGPLHAGPA